MFVVLATAAVSTPSWWSLNELRGLSSTALLCVGDPGSRPGLRSITIDSSLKFKSAMVSAANSLPAVSISFWFEAKYERGSLPVFLTVMVTMTNTPRAWAVPAVGAVSTFVTDSHPCSTTLESPALLMIGEPEWYVT